METEYDPYAPYYALYGGMEHTFFFDELCRDMEWLYWLLQKARPELQAFHPEELPMELECPDMELELVWGPEPGKKPRRRRDRWEEEIDDSTLRTMMTRKRRMPPSRRAARLICRAA